MKKIILIIILFVAIQLNAHILRVGANQTYSGIQTAINQASDLDTVLVYPGTYIERLKINQKSLTLASLYLTTGDSLYASQTIIDADYVGNCLFVINSPYIKIAGFTFQHGTGEFNPDNDVFEYGSVSIRFCDQFVVDNNIIQYNSSSSGGGLYIFHSSGILSANVIRYNITTDRGFAGGLTIAKNSSMYPGDPTVVIDPIRRNDVYFNTGQVATDIMFFDYESYHVPLNRFTVAQPNDYFIRLKLRSFLIESQSFDMTYDIREAMIEEVNADVYVSTNGDDNNSGLSPDQALKTLFQAVLRVKGDSLHQRTIFVEPGVYSYEEGVSLLPLKLKSYVNIVGMNGSFTIDAANKYAIIRTLTCTNNKIENMNVINASEKYYLSKFLIRSDNFEANNINIDGTNDLRSASHFEVQDYSGLNLKNLTLKGRGSHYAIICQNRNPVVMSNISIDNFGAGIGIMSSEFFNSDEQLAIPIYLSNILMKNVKNQDVSAVDGSRLITLLDLFGDTTQIPQKFILSNISLINNNTSNSAGSMIIQGKADIEMYNSIIYNHYANSIRHNLQFSDQTALYKNCFFPLGDNTLEIISPYDYVLTSTMENIISGDPMLFSWGGYDCIPSENSPLVDAGTLDLPEGLILPDTDLAGNPRITGNSIDIGAFEFQPFMNTDESVEIIKPINISFYPNPLIGASSHRGNFNIKLNEKGVSELSIFNIKGQKVRTLMQGYREKGESTIYWDAKDEQGNSLPSGVYIYKLSCNGNEISDKFTVIK